MSDAMMAVVKSTVTRGKVARADVGGRTFLQITGLDGVIQQTVELLLPPGYSARPLAGADLALLQVLGSGDHVVALGGDMLGHAITDLAPGEFGFSDGTQMIVFRKDHLQVEALASVSINAPVVTMTGVLSVGTGASGTFTSSTGSAVTVRDGIVTNIY
jgi:phage gp45-like